MTTSTQQERLLDLTVLRCAAGTDVGMRRDENQDSFGIIKAQTFHGYFVADGMGGVHGGAVASRMAVSGLEELLRKESAIDNDLLVTALEGVNTRIFEKGSSDPSLAGMGTTIVGLVFTPNGVTVINVGDSRAYRVRGDSVIQLSEDHTLVKELLKSGAISPEQAENHPVSHMLTRSLGPLGDVQIDCVTLNEVPEIGDVYLLCSDGLYNFVSELEMLEVVRQNPLDDANQILINLANQRGGADNITVVVVAVGDLAGKGRSAAYRKARDSTSNAGNGASQSDVGPAPLVEEPRTEDHRNDERRDDESSAPAPAPSTKELTVVPEKSEKEPPTDNPSASEQGVSTAERVMPLVEEPRNHKATTNIDPLRAAKAREASDDHAESAGTKNTKGGDESRSGGGRSVPVPLLVVAALVFGLVVGSVARRLVPANEAGGEAGANGGSSVSSSAVAGGEVSGVLDGGIAAGGVGVPASGSGGSESNVVAQLSVDNDSRPNGDDPSDGEVAESNARVQSDRDRMIKARTFFDSSIRNIEEQLAAFDKPITGVVGEKLDATRKQADDLQGKLADVELQIDAASRKLSQWYGRQKRLETTDPLKLAAEVGASSEAVQGKKSAFERATYEFIKKRDEFELYPSNEKLREQVTQLKDQRAQLLRELQDEVRRTVEGVLSETDKQLEDLKFQRDMLNIQLQAVKQDLEVAKSLTDPDPTQRQRVRKKLEQKRQGLLSSLAELERMLSGQEPGKGSNVNGFLANGSDQESQ